ncbi:hypothetical protein AAVH_12695 [Aphelenchoides avenae]|nr:hypothetical protein AAVH_12695 [Aphelenchus avenae]
MEAELEVQVSVEPFGCIDVDSIGVPKKRVPANRHVAVNHSSVHTRRHVHAPRLPRSRPVESAFGRHSAESSLMPRIVSDDYTSHKKRFFAISSKKPTNDQLDSNVWRMDDPRDSSYSEKVTTKQRSKKSNQPLSLNELAITSSESLTDGKDSGAERNVEVPANEILSSPKSTSSFENSQWKKGAKQSPSKKKVCQKSCYPMALGLPEDTSSKVNIPHVSMNLSSTVASDSVNRESLDAHSASSLVRAERFVCKPDNAVELDEYSATKHSPPSSKGVVSGKLKESASSGIDVSARQITPSESQLNLAKVVPRNVRKTASEKTTTDSDKSTASTKSASPSLRGSKKALVLRAKELGRRTKQRRLNWEAGLWIILIIFVAVLFYYRSEI